MRTARPAIPSPRAPRDRATSILLIGIMLGTSLAVVGAGASASVAAPRGADRTVLHGASVNGVAELAEAKASLAPATTSRSVRPAIAGPSWVAVNEGAPTPRSGSSMVWDATDKEYLFFGGTAGLSYYGGTWTLASDGNWAQIFPPTSPSPRAFAAMAYDPADHYVVLFGGLSASGVLGDTWKFVGGAWTKLAPTSSPAARYEGSLAADAATGKLLFFGGNGTSARLVAGTWEFGAGTWTVLHPVNSPPIREGAAFDADPASGTPILFGGTGIGNVVLNDTWNFSGGSWHKLATKVAPPARSNAAIGYSPSDASLVLFGGEANPLSGIVFSDTWTFSAGKWTKISTAASPSRRYDAAGADGAGGLGAVIFGGAYVGAKNDTWSYAGHAWSRLVPTSPAGRVAAAMAWDSAKQEVVLYGGYDPTGPLYYTDTWTFVGGVWTPHVTKKDPGPLVYAMMSDDPTDGYVVLFGGVRPNGTSPCGTWAFTGAKWTEVVSACASQPVPRYAGGMTFDAAAGYVILFSGANASYGSNFTETWAYAHGAWTSLYPSASPPDTFDFQMAYDSADGYVVLYGGEVITSSSIYLSNSTWIFSGGTWTNVTSIFGVHPGTYTYGILADDPYMGYDLMFGGYDLYSSSVAGVYNYSGGIWAKPTLGAAAPAVYDPVGAYDPVDNYVVMFSGYLSASAFLTSDSTWVWSGA
jgi:hypothetical protein